jgi:uncharacterized protein
MRHTHRIAVIIPALNEEGSIGHVVDAIPQWVDDVIVADNGSSDGTAERARQAGARVIRAPRRGYGNACLAAIDALDEPDIVVFLDGDFSDHPQEADLLVDPIIAGDAEMVIGSRVLGLREPGALTIQQRLGNGLACLLIRLFWRVEFSDLGPFRAIRYRTLQRLGMCDRNYGWTVEMQIKAARAGVPMKEVPVSYRRRIGTSKVSGTMRGVVGAGAKILSTIFLTASRLMASPNGSEPTRRAMVFTRYPVSGKTKTRLIPALGAEGAARLHRRMTERTVCKARRLQRGPVSIEVLFEGGTEKQFRDWLGEDLAYRGQGPGDLGERMLNGFRGAFREGIERAVLFGTDLPGLSPETVDRALRELDNHDLVLGPASDGGYYLIGLKRSYGELFAGLPWGSPEVFEKTAAIGRDLGLSVALVDRLDDLDRPEDLTRWEKELFGHSDHGVGDGKDFAPSITVVIPALNEERSLGKTLDRVRVEPHVEVIVVDGGSADATVALAEARGVRVIRESPGRARQMNTGADQGSGEILLFLHADTLLPEGWARRVRETLIHSRVVAGAFELKIDSPMRGLRVIERLTRFRSTVLQTPYGDQALFVRREEFERVGGFPEIPIMEDYALVKKLRKLGRIATVSDAVLTSPRRWEELGVWKATAINQIMLAGFVLGLPLKNLERLYRRKEE